MAQNLSQQTRGVSERPRLVKVGSRGSDGMDHQEIIPPHVPHPVRRMRARLSVSSATAVIIIGLGLAWIVPQLMESTPGPLPKMHSSDPGNGSSVASERQAENIPPLPEVPASAVPQQMEVADAATPPSLPTDASSHDTAQMPAQDEVPVSVPPADDEKGGRDAPLSAASVGAGTDVAESDAHPSPPPGAAAPAVRLAAASAPAVREQSVVIYYLLGMKDSERRARAFAARLEPEFDHVELDAVPHAYGIGRVRFSSASDQAAAQKVGRVFEDMGYGWRLIRLSGSHTKPRPGRIDVWIPDS